ncbi:MAG: hypothetical protein AAFN27_10245 [Pseudomonadota bacterium]
MSVDFAANGIIRLAMMWSISRRDRWWMGRDPHAALPAAAAHRAWHMGQLCGTMRSPDRSDRAIGYRTRACGLEPHIVNHG